MDKDIQEKTIVEHQILRRIRSGVASASYIAKEAGGRRVILTYFDFDKVKERYRAVASGDGVPTAELDAVAEPQAKRYMEEVKQAAIRVKDLERDHVGQIFDWGVDKETGNLVVIKEYIHGVDIMYALDGLKPIHSICMFAQAAKGLDSIHKSGFLHLNIKPNRIQVNFDDDKPFVKITDFGFAVPKTGHTGDYFGSAHYMSPEAVFNDHGKVDERADMFSLGVTMYHCLTGALPFEKRAAAKGNRRKLKVIVERENFVEPPSHFNREIPEALDKIILGILEHDPDKRAYSRALDLLGAFHENWPNESVAMPIDGTSTLLGRK